MDSKADSQSSSSSKVLSATPFPLPHRRYLPHYRYPTAATPQPLPHHRYPTTTLGGRPQQQNNGQPEQQQQQEQQQQGGPPDLGAAATASPAWAPPVPVQLDHAPSTFLPLAPTGLELDGWMMGNDLQTVTSVWQLHLDIEAWLADHEDRRERWWGTALNPKARIVQERLRNRRKIVWTQIQRCAVLRIMETADVVESLQRSQIESQAAISRVEIWAADAKKSAKENPTHAIDMMEVAARYVTLTIVRAEVNGGTGSAFSVRQ